MRKCLLFLLFLSVGLAPAYAYSAESDSGLAALKRLGQPQGIVEKNGYIYVKVYYEMGENDTKAGARERLKQKAVKLVSEYKGGEYASVTLIMKESGASGDDLRYFNSASVSTLGFIEKNELLAEEISGDKITAYYKFRYRVVEGNKPEFGFSAEMKNRRLREGDKISVEYSVRKKAYVYIFDLYADGAVLLFPNGQNGQNAISAGKYVFPSAADLKRGVHFDAGLPEGKKESLETIRAVVTGRPLDFSRIKNQEDILQELFKLKRDEFEFIDLDFSISGK